MPLQDGPAMNNVIKFFFFFLQVNMLCSGPEHVFMACLTF